MTNHQRLATATCEHATITSTEESTSSAGNQKPAAETEIPAKALQDLEMPAERLSHVQKQLDELDVKE